MKQQATPDKTSAIIGKSLCKGYASMMVISKAGAHYQKILRCFCISKHVKEVTLACSLLVWKWILIRNGFIIFNRGVMSSNICLAALNAGVNNAETRVWVKVSLAPYVNVDCVLLSAYDATVLVVWIDSFNLALRYGLILMARAVKMSQSQSRSSFTIFKFVISTLLRKVKPFWGRLKVMFELFIYWQ